MVADSRLTGRGIDHCAYTVTVAQIQIRQRPLRVDCRLSTYSDISANEAYGVYGGDAVGVGGVGRASVIRCGPNMGPRTGTTGQYGSWHAGVAAEPLACRGLADDDLGRGRGCSDRPGQQGLREITCRVGGGCGVPRHLGADRGARSGRRPARPAAAQASAAGGRRRIGWRGPGNGPGDRGARHAGPGHRVRVVRGRSGAGSGLDRAPARARGPDHQGQQPAAGRHLVRLDLGAVACRIVERDRRHRAGAGRERRHLPDRRGRAGHAPASA